MVAALVANAQLTPVLTSLVVSTLPTILLLFVAVVATNSFEDVGLPVQLNYPAATVLGGTAGVYAFVVPWPWGASIIGLIALVIVLRIMYPRWARWATARASADNKKKKRRMVAMLDIKGLPWLFVVLVLFQGAFGAAQPWISREVIYERSGAVLVGYVIRSDDPLVFASSDGGVQYIDRANIADRQPCNMRQPTPSVVGLGNHFGGKHTLVCPKSKP